MNKLPYGVIGLGHLGQIHTRIAAQMQMLELVGVFDIDRERGQKVAQEYQTSHYPSLEALLEHVEAVSVVVPTDQHFAVASRAMDFQRHVFIEKPITATVPEARTLLDKARQKNCKLQVGHIERFNPAFLALQDYPLEPKFIESHRLSKFNPRGTEVSVILDLMIHDIDIVLSLIPSPLLSIHASGVAVVSESEDIANVRMTFENNTVANLTSSRISVKDMRKMRLFQKNSYIAIDFLEQKTEILYLNDLNDPVHKPENTMSLGLIGSSSQKKEILWQKPAVPAINSLQKELEEFVSCIHHDQMPCVTGQDGLRALEVAANILDQIKNS